MSQEKLASLVRRMLVNNSHLSVEDRRGLLDAYEKLVGIKPPPESTEFSFRHIVLMHWATSDERREALEAHEEENGIFAPFRLTASGLPDLILDFDEWLSIRNTLYDSMGVADMTKRIAAIKILREVRSLGLKEAKDYIDGLPQSIPVTSKAAGETPSSVFQVM